MFFNKKSVLSSFHFGFYDDVLMDICFFIFIFIYLKQHVKCKARAANGGDVKTANLANHSMCVC